MESGFRLENSAVLLAAPVAVSVHYPAAGPCAEEVTEKAWNVNESVD